MTAHFLTSSTSGDESACSSNQLNLPRTRFRRNRHGRLGRCIYLNRNLPAWKTRAEKFDDLVVKIAMDIAVQAAGRVDGIEIAVENVPASDPSPWEAGSVALSRSFPADRAAGFPARIVIYRKPVEARAVGLDRAQLIHDVLVAEIAQLLGCFPEDIATNPYGSSGPGRYHR